MKTVLFITNSLGFGGAEKIIAFVCNRLSRRGYRCGIINLNGVPDYVNVHKQKLDEAVSVFGVESIPKGINKNIYKIAKIYKAAKSIDADVLIGFTEFPNLYAVVTGWLLGKKSIVSERGDPNSTGVGKGLKNRIVLELINRASGGVFQTEGAKQFYGKGLQKRGVVIPNPIFINGELPCDAHDQRERTVVFVGRLVYCQKRCDVMLHAFRAFHEKHPEYVLKLYGRGPDEESIKMLAEKLGLAESVSFMGLTTQPIQDISRDGMFLITSDYEGISNALLEAMAAGLPCVSTDHSPGGARLLITDRENGLLAPVGDPEALARAMCEFAENKELAEKCGGNARQVLCRFAPDHIMDQWEDYINRII